MARLIIDNQDRLVFHCPACRSRKYLPQFDWITGRGWKWNSDNVAPTLSPSILQSAGPYPEGHPKAGTISVCHSYVRDGRIEYLSDCTHDLAGQTVELPDLPPEID